MLLRLGDNLVSALKLGSQDVSRLYLNAQSISLGALVITSSSTQSAAENATLSHGLTANESVTWAIVGGADQSKFEISGSTLRWTGNGTKNYEIPDDANSDNVYVVQVRATGAHGTATQTISVTVTDVFEGSIAKPTLTITSATNINTPSFQLTGDLQTGDLIRVRHGTISDFTGATEITHIITSGEATALEFDFATGALPDGLRYFDARIERGVSVSPYSDVVSETIDVTVPVITSSITDSVAGNAVLAHSLTANESVTWDIVGGDDQSKFEISGSTLRWVSNGTKDFAAPDDSDANNTYIVQVMATDTAGNQQVQTITVTVTNPVAVSAFSAATKSLHIILSNNNLTATAGSGSNIGTDVYSSASYSTEKKFFSLHINSSSAIGIGIGLVDSTFVADAGAWPGGDHHGFATFSDGNCYASGDGTVTAVVQPFFVFNDDVDLAVDGGAKKAWWRRGGGFWNASLGITGDPTNPSDSLAIDFPSSIGALYRLVVELETSGAVVTINTTPPFGMPSGYTQG